MKLKKNILKYLVLGPSAVGLLILGLLLWEGSSGPFELTMLLGAWYLGLFVFLFLSFIYYLVNRYIISNIGYFLLYPIPFYIVLIGWTFYKEEGLPTDVEIYVGAYLIALIFSFVFLFARAKWRAATSKQKIKLIVGQLTTTVSLAALDIFVPQSISGAIQGSEIFTGVWFYELMIGSFLVYWGIYLAYKYVILGLLVNAIKLWLYNETIINGEKITLFSKSTSVLYKEAKVNAKEELKHIRAMHKVSQGELPDEDYIKETLSPVVKSVAEVMSEELSTNADQTSKKDKT